MRYVEAPVGYILCLDKLETFRTMCDCCNKPRVFLFLCCSCMQLRQNGINLPVHREYESRREIQAPASIWASHQVLARFSLLHGLSSPLIGFALGPTSRYNKLRNTMHHLENHLLILVVQDGGIWHIS